MSLPTVEKAPAASGLHPAFYIGSWIFFSNSTILFNKYLIDKAGFKYPVILTCWHMIFSVVATQLLARTTTLVDGRKKVKMNGRIYLRSIVPIGLLYSGSLVSSNMTYMYLSVSFIQMLKAAAPVAVLLLSWAWRLKDPSARVLANVCVIVLGVAIASFGEIQFSWVGVLYQMGGIVFEGLRLTMIEVMLAGDADQQKMDPLVSLYYYAPVCAVMNFFVALCAEGPSFSFDAVLTTGVAVLVVNALVAFLLNVASVMLIGKTSSLVLTLTGILKNILLIVVAVLLWSEHVSFLQFLGYSIALAGLTYYSLGWDVIKQRLVASFEWTYSLFKSPQFDESRLSPAARRGLIATLLLLIVSMLVIGFVYDGKAVAEKTLMGLW